MNYFTSLNNLQIKRDYILIEPMLSVMHGLKLFFKSKILYCLTKLVYNFVWS
jgi:hypothetical protein